MQVGEHLHHAISPSINLAMNILMTVLAQIRGQAILKAITNADKGSKIKFTPLAFLPFHFGLKDHQGILAPAWWLDALGIIYPGILKDNHMIAASHMPIQVRPAPDDPKMPELSLGHGKLMQLSLVAGLDVPDEGVQLLVSVVVEVLLDEEEGFLLCGGGEFLDQAVDLALQV